MATSSILRRSSSRISKIIIAHRCNLFLVPRESERINGFAGFSLLPPVMQSSILANAGHGQQQRQRRWFNPKSSSSTPEEKKKRKSQQPVMSKKPAAAPATVSTTTLESPRILPRWSWNWVNISTISLACLCVLLRIYIWYKFEKLERIPYTGRFHFVLGDQFQKKLSDEYVNLMKEWEGWIVDPSDPRVIRIQSIARRLVQAMSAGLMLDAQFKINGLDDDDATRLKEGNLGIEDKANLGESAVYRSPKQARKLLWQPATNHLDGKNWRVLLVDSHDFISHCFPNGMFIVSVEALHQLKSDDEIAFCIAHEIAHFVAHHLAETIFWKLALILDFDSGGEPMGGLRKLLLLIQRFIFRRREAEADHIGLLIMASAGYDPHVALRICKSQARDLEAHDLYATHPSGDERAKLLNQSKVMGKALAVYREVKAGNGVRSFV